MRNATYSSSLSSSQQILTSAVDFNRARSSESTENAMGGCPTSNKNHHHSSSMSVASSSAGASFASAEGRGVPISPKKMPLTPPRDHGSPYKSAQQQHYQHQQHHAYAAPATAAVRQPFLSSFHQDSSSSPSPFLRPSNSSSSSSWRNTQQDDGNNYDQVSSIFRSAPTSSSAREDVDAGGFYTLQRCSAFDEDDSDSEEDECYNGMAAF